MSGRISKKIRRRVAELGYGKSNRAIKMLKANYRASGKPRPTVPKGSKRSQRNSERTTN